MREIILKHSIFARIVFGSRISIYGLAFLMAVTAVLPANALVLKRTQKVQVESKWQVHREGKIQILESSELVTKSDALIVTIDNDCAQVRGGSISANIVAKRKRMGRLRVQSYSLRLRDDLTVGQLGQLAESDPCVKIISRDGIARIVATPNDPSYTSQKQMAAVRAPAAFDTFFPVAGGGITQDIVVAVIDTGIDKTHSDLMGNLWKNANGEIGYNYIAGNALPVDDNGHGTFVAGQIAGVCNNGIGICGVAGYRTKVMAIKVLDASGSGTYTDIVNGINFAIQNGAKVINMSLAGTATSTSVRDAVISAVDAGIFVAAAAGNDNKQLSTTNVTVPALYAKDISGFMSVGSIDSVTFARSSFSNFGTTTVEIGAPGSNGIYSTAMGGSYSTLQGTSMASPMVAGAGALALGLTKSRGYTLSAAQVEALIASAAIEEPGLQTSFVGGKRLDLLSLANQIDLQYPMLTNPLDVEAPQVQITSLVNNAVILQSASPITISATANDNVGVTSLAMTIDGAAVAPTISGNNILYSWNASAAALGKHVIGIWAQDAAGNRSSTSIAITLQAPPDTTAPTVSINSPANGATIVGTSNTVSISASDNKAVTSVVIAIDGVDKATLTSAPYTYAWNTSGLSIGSHTIKATAFDAAGNSANVTHTVNVGDTIAPTLSFVGLVEGQQLATNATYTNFSVNAADNIAIAKVVININGKDVATLTAAPYSYSWNTKSLKAGSKHVVKATATDTAGNAASISVNVKKKHTFWSRIF
jgi:thermitase